MNKMTYARLVRAMAVAGAGLLVASHASAVSFTFDSVSSQLIDSRTTSFASLELEPFDITNNTGIVWTDFHLALVGHGEIGDYDFMHFGDIGAAGIYSGPGVASFADVNVDSIGLNEVLTIDGLNIASGGVLSFNVDIFGGLPEGLVSFDIYGLPSVEQNGGGPNDGGPTDGGPTGAIPEPTASVLFLVGVTCLGSGMRRKTHTR